MKQELYFVATRLEAHIIYEWEDVTSICWYFGLNWCCNMVFVEVKKECGNCRYYGKIKMMCYLRKETRFTHEEACHHFDPKEW